MSNPELCPTCQPHGTCLFEAAAKFVAKGVPPLKQQTPLDTDGITTEVSAALAKISELRKTAIKEGCPWEKTVDPKFPGKPDLKKGAKRS